MINAIGIYVGNSRSANGAISASGKVVIPVFGDSIPAGSNNSTGAGPTPTAGTVQQWNASSSQVTNVGASDVYNVVVGGGTFMPRFGIDFYTATGLIPVFVPCGSPGANLAPEKNTICVGVCY